MSKEEGRFSLIECNSIDSKTKEKNTSFTIQVNDCDKSNISDLDLNDIRELNLLLTHYLNEGGENNEQKEG